MIRLSRPVLRGAASWCRPLGTAASDAAAKARVTAKMREQFAPAEASSTDSGQSLVGEHHAPLRNDVRLLGQLLGEQISSRNGQDQFDKVEQVRLKSKHWREGDADGKAFAGKEGYRLVPARHCVSGRLT
jgi:hypothetical protein